MNQYVYLEKRGIYEMLPIFIYNKLFLISHMNLSFLKVPVNKYFYTIKVKAGLNNKYEVYRRCQIIYGRFIDQLTFEYKTVYNGEIQDDGFKKYCRKTELLMHDNNQIYMMETYEEIKKLYDIIKAEFKKVPMKYNDKASIEEILRRLGKI